MSTGPEFVQNETRIEQPIMAAQVLATSPIVAGTTVRSAYIRSFAPDAWIAAIAGFAITVVGLLAITRGGFDGSMDDPVVQVMGFNHTTLLGLIEAAVGASLLISGVTRSRGTTLFVSSVLALGAIIGAFQTDSFVTSLALESNLAWLLLAIAAVVALTTAVLPRTYRSSTVVQAE